MTGAEEAELRPFRGASSVRLGTRSTARRHRVSKLPGRLTVAEDAAHARPSYAGKLLLSTDLLRLILALLVVFAVSRVHEQYGLLVIVRQIALVGLLVGIVAFVDPRLIQPRTLFSTWPARVMAGLGIMAVLSIPFALSVGASGSFVLRGYSKVLLLAFLVIVGIRHTRDLYTMVTAFVVGSAVLAFLSLFAFGTGVLGDNGLSRILVGSGFSFDSNDLGTMASAGIAVSLMLVACRSGAIRIVAGLTALGLVAAIARTGSRGGFLGLIGLGLGVLILARGIQLWKRVAFLAVAAGALFLATPARYWEQMATIGNIEEDYNWTSPSGRREVWKRGLGYMFSYPLTGVGVSNFPRAEGSISSLARQFVPGRPGIKWSAPHNSFLEAGAEMGLPGLVLFSSLVIGGIVGMARLRGKLPAWWKHGTEEQRFLLQAPTYLSLAMIGFAVAGFFVSFAYLDLVYLLGALMSGTYFCSRQMLAADSDVPGRRRGGPASTRS